MGVSWDEFWHMNPRILGAISDGYARKIKNEYEEKNIIAHLQGVYFADAIMSTVGNALFKGGKHSYPKKPYKFFEENISDNNNSNEEIAVFEMKQRINALNNMGLKESPM